MGKEFDDLFDDFINRKPSKGKPKDEGKKPSDELYEKIKRVIENLPDMRDITSLDDLQGIDKLGDDLGKPDDVDISFKAGKYINKLTWKLKHGSLTKFIISDTPYQSGDVNVESLKEQLDKAVADEDYETAAGLRDLIEANKLGENNEKKSEK